MSFLHIFVIVYSCSFRSVPEMAKASKNIQQWIVTCKRDFTEMAELCERLLLERSALEEENTFLKQQLLQVYEEREQFLKRVNQSTDQSEVSVDQENVSFQEENGVLNNESNSGSTNDDSDVTKCSIDGYSVVTDLNVKREFFGDALDRSMNSSLDGSSILGEYFQCDVCGEVFSQTDQLELHDCRMAASASTSSTKIHQAQNLSSINHKNQHASIINNGNLKASASSLQLQKQRRHKCRFCGHAFKLKADQVRHEYIHTGEKPYGCDICGARFRQPGARSQHVRRHLSKSNSIAAAAAAAEWRQCSECMQIFQCQQFEGHLCIIKHDNINDANNTLLNMA